MSDGSELGRASVLAVRSVIERALGDLAAAGAGTTVQAQRLRALLEIITTWPEAAGDRRLVSQLDLHLEGAHDLLNGKPAERRGPSGKIVQFPLDRVAGVERMLSKRQLAEVLGVSVSWIDKAMARRELPSVLVGGVRRFRYSEVEAWLGQRQD
jgi:excisionase family DNA binding protein